MKHRKNMIHKLRWYEMLWMRSKDNRHVLLHYVHSNVSMQGRHWQPLLVHLWAYCNPPSPWYCMSLEWLPKNCTNGAKHVSCYADIFARVNGFWVTYSFLTLSLSPHNVSVGTLMSSRTSWRSHLWSGWAISAKTVKKQRWKVVLFNWGPRN